VLDKTTGVRSRARLSPEPMLQRSERADPAPKLDRGSPDCRRYVQVRDFRPPQHQQPAEDDEQYEEKVQGDNEVGQERG
jgi:hypothetical protein